MVPDPSGIRPGLGSGFRTVTRVRVLNEQALGELMLPEGMERSGVPIHPAMVEGACHVLAAVAGPVAW